MIKELQRGEIKTPKIPVSVKEILRRHLHRLHYATIDISEIRQKLSTYHNRREPLEKEKEIHFPQLTRGRGSHTDFPKVDLKRERLPFQYNLRQRNAIHCSLLATTIRKN